MMTYRRPVTRSPAESARKDPLPNRLSIQEQAQPRESLWSTLLPATPCEVVTRSIATAGLLVILYVGFVLLYSHLP
jgi:hypothetical protein